MSSEPGMTSGRVTASRAEYTEALTLSSGAYEAFTKHLQACPACRPVRTPCPARDDLYATASRLRRAVDDIVAAWAAVGGGDRMTPAAPSCPGGKRFPHARAAKRYAFENEPDKTRRPVHVQCDGHYHLAPRDAAPTQPRRTSGDGTNDETRS